MAREPVLVHTMGKVGSSSITAMLASSQRFEPIQIHMLRADKIEALEAKHRARGLEVPQHLRDARRVLDEILPGTGRVRIVSLVRDPVARNLSAYFQNLDIWKLGWQPGADVTPYIASFFTEYPHHVPLVWFDRQLKATLGLDVFSVPFDFHRERLILRTDRYELIVLRCELPDPRKKELLEEFLGETGLPLGRANEAHKKSYAAAYKEVLAAIELPTDYLDRQYDSPCARHFYTEVERASFRRRWRRRRPRPAREGLWLPDLELLQRRLRARSRAWLQRLWRRFPGRG